MKKIFYSIFFLMLSAYVFSVPAKPGILKVKQPDGSIIDVCLYGDEHFSYTTTKDGFLIVENNNGYYEYATLTNNNIKSTGVKVNDYNNDNYQKLSDIKSLCKVDINELNKIRNIKVKSTTQKYTTKSLVNRNPAPKGLVILVNFADEKFTTPNAKDNFHNLLNENGYSENGATGSAVDYFKDSSSDKYIPSFDVYGPYTLDRNMAFYGQNDFSGNDKAGDQMIVDAMTKLMQDDTLNINMSDYDSDNNDTIDIVFVYYAGVNEAEGGSKNTIWPHSWEIYNSYVSGNTIFGGKQLCKYACTSELTITENGERRMCGIGTFCHEFSHVLGLPDFYSTSYNGHKTLGNWDVMDAGPYNNEGRTPPAYSAYERFFMNWMTPSIIDKDGSYELKELKQNNTAYLLSENNKHNLNCLDPDPSEFYLLEYRDKSGWDKYLPGEGMLITKVRFNQRTWYNNTVNNSKNEMGVDIIDAKTEPGDTKGTASDTYPGSANITSFTAYRGHKLSDITIEENKITFNVGINVDAPTINNDSIYISDNMIYGIKEGSKLYCYDISGRLIWSDLCNNSPYRFTLPKGMFIIIIEENESRYVLKVIEK